MAANGENYQQKYKISMIVKKFIRILLFENFGKFPPSENYNTTLYVTLNEGEKIFLNFLFQVNA